MMSEPGGPIKLFVLGDARILTPIGEIDPTAEFVFATALYLLMERHTPVFRRKIESLLWPTADGPITSHRLRQTLLKIRKLGVPVQTVGTGRVQVTCAVQIDADALLVDPDLSSLAEPKAFAPLADYEPSVSHAFTQWVESKRSEYHAPIVELFLKALAEHRARGDWTKAASLASHLLRLAPYNEEATLTLAESHVMRGSKRDGLQILDQYLSDLGTHETEIRLPASVMRNRIAERIPARTPTDGYSPPFVGRGESMSALASLIPRIRNGKGGACHVWGEAGIGKTRLLAEFATFAALQGLSTVRSNCRPSDPNRPLSVFVDIVEVLRGLRGAIGCSPETFHYLDRLTLHRAESGATSGPGEADFVYAKVQRAVFDLLDAVADERPLLILVEDVHRLDEVSASLFFDLIPWITDRPILIAFSSREASYPWLNHTQGYLFDLPLLPLDAEPARQLILAIAGQSARNISDADQQWCISSAEGNPYFLAELATHLLESGGRHDAPPSLTAVINQRLSRLEPETLQLLQTCALLDKNSSMERIEHVLGYDHHQLLQCINELGNLGMLVLERGKSGNDSLNRLAPRHELLAIAAESALAPPALAYLHRRIGVVLEAEIVDNGSTSIVWDCAKHWQRAGDSERAFSLARSCVQHLMKLGLCGAAAEAYQKALAFCRSEQERLDMLRGEAAAYFGASDWVNLSKVAGTIHNLQAYLEPESEGHDDVELMALRALWQRGELDLVRAKALSCLESSAASVSHRVRAGVMSLMLLDLACDHVAMEKTHRVLKPLLNLPEVDESYRHEAHMVYEAVCGDLRIAVEHAQRLVNFRRESGLVADLTRALTNASVAVRTAGRVDLAKTWLHEALSIYESHKLPLATEVPMQILASIALEENEIDVARDWHEKLACLPPSPPDAALVRASIGVRIALCDRDAAKARGCISTDLNQLRADTNPHRRIYGVALLVAVQLAEGGLPDTELLDLLESSHLIARKNTRQAFSTFVLVVALRKAGQQGKADRLLKEYCEQYRREPTPPPYHVLELLESFVLS